MHLLSVLLLFALAGCSQAPEEKMQISLDKNGSYTGFANLPANYTKEQAVKDGCYVVFDSNKVAGAQGWADFQAQVNGGHEASLRLVRFSGTDVYYIDLFYDGASYHAFDSTSPDLLDRKFSYCMDLTGKMYGTDHAGHLVVLTNDKNLTFKKYLHAITSSDTATIQSIVPYVWLPVQ